MKIIIHPVIATSEEERSYYAGCWNYPHIKVTPYGVNDQVKAQIVTGVNHRNELMEREIGFFNTKEQAVAAVLGTV